MVNGYLQYEVRDFVSKPFFFFFHGVVLVDAQFLEDESTKIFARKVADHYSARTNQTLEEREASVIIHLKKLNNWVCLVKHLKDSAELHHIALRLF